MEEMRVQIEAREPTDGEIRAFWFTLPIDIEQVEELLGIDIDTDYYSITGKEFPFADEVQEDTTIERLDDLYHTYESLPSDLKEDYGELMCYFTDLDELHRYRNDIIHYSWCKNMTDVARHILNNDPDFTSLSESVTRYFDYEAYPGGGEKAISDGVYIDMAPYVETYMPNYRTLRETDETVRKMTISDTGKMWGIYPFFCNNDMELCAEPSWIGMVIRQDWLDDLGLEQPHTIDEWHTVLTAFKEEKGAEAPLLLSKTGIMPYDYFLSAFGVKSEFYKDGDTVKYGPLEEGYRQYLELMSQWYAEGLVDQNFISNEITGNAPTDYIATGKSGAATYSWAGTGNYLYETGSSTDPKINWQPITGPVLKEGDVCQSRNVSYIALTPVSVTTACENPEIAAKWLDYQYTKDGFIANSFGDSECYTVDEEGNYAFTDKIMNGEHGVSPQIEQFSYRRKDFPGLVSWEVYDLTNPAERLAAREVYDSDGTDLVLPKIEMTDEEGKEYNSLYTDIQTYVQEKTAGYIMGSESLDTYDDFVETIKGMNIDRCIEIQQAALDRYSER